MLQTAIIAQPLFSQERKNKELVIEKEGIKKFLYNGQAVLVPIKNIKDVETLREKTRMIFLNATQGSSMTYRIRRIQIQGQGVYIHFDQKF